MDILFRENNSKYSSLLCASGSYALGSNAITNAFFGKFYNGGFIDQAMKDKVTDKLVNENRFGADINMGIDYLYLPDTFMGKPHLGFFAAVKNREHFDTRFSKDFFQLGFYGNKDFAGETAVLNDFNLNLLRYQQFQLGLLWAGLDTAKAKLGLGLSFLVGEQLLSMTARTAELYTSSDGTYIDLKTQATMLRSDSSAKGLGSVNGLGASADIFLEAPYKLRKRKGVIHIRISDMGTIFWNKNSLRYSTDSTYHYDGFTVDNIFDLQDSTFKTNIGGDVIEDNLAVEHKAFSTTIPASIEISTNTSYGKLNIVKGFRYFFNANYKGLYYIKANYFITPGLMIGTKLGYGGYSNFNYGIEFGADMGHGLVLLMGSNNIEGFIVSSSTTAQGAYLHLKKYF